MTDSDNDPNTSAKENAEAGEAKKGKTLSLKRTVESGQVRQSFAHGRSKAVVVEKRKKRTIRQGEVIEDAAEGNIPTPAVPEAIETLSKREQNKRLEAVEEAKRRAELEVIEAQEAERLAAEAKLEEESRFAAEQAAEKKAEKKAQKKSGKDEIEVMDPTDVPVEPSEADARVRRTTSKVASKTTPAPTRDEEGRADPKRTDNKKGERRRREGKLTINDALNDEERMRSLASIKRRREREKRQADVQLPQEKQSRTITVPETITIQELANRMAERATDVIKVLMQQGMMLKINDVIDADTAQIVAEDFGHSVKRVAEGDIEEGLIGGNDDVGAQTPRPPVVTIMGHVDHGKTSLLDALRETKVAAGEAGGITQHIGAYQSFTKEGQVVSFVDTPGHAAFSAMRARGAKVTDIVVLVVAADDSVQPQTIEAIAHAKEAGAPIIVAINKIDKPEADVTRVKNDLLQHEIIAEEMGGETQMVPVSAKDGTGLDDLLEGIILQAQLMDLKANATRAAEGVVIEARLDKGRGPVATILVQRGTLRAGDIFVVGEESGKVRALHDANGKPIKEAPPSMPVEVLGISGAPRAGEVLSVVENDARAREVADYRARKYRQQAGADGQGRTTSLDQLMALKAAQAGGTDKKELTIIVKGDVQGSVEAIAQAVEKLGNEEVGARVVLSAVGGINESDVTLANASGAVIVGFNVRARREAQQAAEVSGIEIRYYNVIYDLVDDLQAAMSGMLSPELRETLLGKAAVLDVFSIKGGRAAGCRIEEGAVKRGAKVRIIRDDIVVHEGDLSSLRRFKDEVKEATGGQECGMAFATFADVKQGDMIECFEVESVSRQLQN
ncbi:MAG: translation initiation factor IF-2 [Alphaproteobacteria bacterium]|nr:translation initiation factor IF-2 [Alphaproteobacteria bacterium]MBE8219694.1 translation initiation factor IF-2 [Alphaproteobacteria bacterium]